MIKCWFQMAAIQALEVGRNLHISTLLSIFMVNCLVAWLSLPRQSQMHLRSKEINKHENNYPSKATVKKSCWGFIYISRILSQDARKILSEKPHFRFPGSWLKILACRKESIYSYFRALFSSAVFMFYNANTVDAHQHGPEDFLR